MASKEARDAAIRKAGEQVRAGGPFARASADSKVPAVICGVVVACGPNDEPLACGYRKGHRGKHSWATLPTWLNGVDPESVEGAAHFLETANVGPPEAKGHWINAAGAIRLMLQRGEIKRRKAKVRK